MFLFKTDELYYLFSVHGISGICRGPRVSGAPRTGGKIKKIVLPNCGIASGIVFTTAILHWHDSV